MSSICPICGVAGIEKRQGYYTHLWPCESPVPQSIFADAEWDTCIACGEDFLPQELNGRIEAERYKLEGLLSPKEIKVIRERMGLSQVAIAQLLGVGDKTYARWESGMSIQNKSMDNMIRIVSECPELYLGIEAKRDPMREQQVEEYIRAFLPSQTPRNEFALAAHGDQLDVETIEKLQIRLRQLLKQRA